ncbi:MAG: CDP-glucose 4,6-dehydratase [Deltaproteobacteria bacterium]|nr:CDP-glucose 4,6-dehydratase [Deltaproteobacteria bacterium]
MFNAVYHDKKVLITGHTGFKGSWLALWLARMGATVIGYALEPPTSPNHYQLLPIEVISVIGDIRNAERLKAVVAEHKPDIIFHLAAQPIVRLSYQKPVDTVASNVLGTVNLLEAVRESESVRAVVHVSSDKCYDNREWPWGYREIDAIGGHDPYSASKGCAELIINCWRRSYFNLQDYGKLHHTLLASCRAGNVIGGGDWAADRLIPDMMRAVQGHKKVVIRNPHAVRPWQHVLEPLRGYLLIGQMLLAGCTEYADAWNFGPSDDSALTVAQIVEKVKKYRPDMDCEFGAAGVQPHEAHILRLDCSKAIHKLNWRAVWNGEIAVERTAAWYAAYEASGLVRSLDDLRDYIADAKRERMSWAED